MILDFNPDHFQAITNTMRWSPDGRGEIRWPGRVMSRQIGGLREHGRALPPSPHSFWDATMEMFRPRGVPVLGYTLIKFCLAHKCFIYNRVPPRGHFCHVDTPLLWTLFFWPNYLYTVRFQSDTFNWRISPGCTADSPRNTIKTY